MDGLEISGLVLRIYKERQPVFFTELASFVIRFRKNQHVPHEGHDLISNWE